MRCWSCQEENRGARQYCRACGALLQLICQHCRTANDPGDLFCGGCGRTLPQPRPGPIGRSGRDQPVASAPERRLVTLAFIDLVGSTALSERLDPEDMGELYAAYRSRANEIIESYGGCIAQFVGDGILAYFGYPQAKEDDAVRAIMAGLEIGPAARSLDGAWNRDGHIDLDVRIGVHTGTVVIGTQQTGVHIDPLAVIGGTSNVAARIQNYAEPGRVIITGTTWALATNRFETKDLGRHPMRGVSEPVHILQVIRARDNLTRFEATPDLPPLVGRDAELATILELWERARAGQGQAVHIVGEPGIGKSRLLRAVQDAIEREPVRLVRCQCSPFTTQSTLQPVVVGLQRAAGFLPDDGPDDRLDKLEALLDDAGVPVAQVAPLYAALLALPFERRYGPLRLLPSRQKELTLAAMVDHLRTLASRQPLLLLVEDAHWIDPTSLELLDLLAPSIAGARILLVLTSRPEFAHDLPGAPTTTVALGRLPPDASRALIDRLTGGQPLPPRLETEIIRKTEGIPLFLEELTRTVIDAGALESSPDAGEARTSLEALGIPATLQESLLARLDRLGPAKEVAQIAASVGREFPRRLLAEVAELPPAELDAALVRLADADVIARGATPVPTYGFRHALIRDIAYSSLLRPRRQELHARIARALRRSEPELVATQPELLAFHLSEAGELDAAVDQWLKAGQRALALSANQEAVDHLGRGLELLKALPDTENNRARTLKLLNSRGPAQSLLRGAGSAEVAGTYAEALAVADRLPESPDHFTAHWGWWFISPDFREQERRAQHLERLAARLDAGDLLMQAHHCQWATQLNLGHLDACRRHIQAGLKLYEAGMRGGEIATYGGHDPKVCGLGNAAIAAWLSGEREEARLREAQVLAWAPQTDHAASRVHALEAASQVAFFERDAAGLRRRAEEMQVLATEHGFSGYRIKASIYLGWSMAQSGSAEHGLALVRDGLASFRSVSTGEDSPFFVGMYAELLGKAGQLDEALAELDHMLADMDRSSLRLWRPELERSRGWLLSLRGPSGVEEAEVWYRRALATAAGQGARALERRAAESLSKLAASC
ncbi:MAG: AAA family ATPase [Geminicoccaceae bacterium]